MGEATAEGVVGQEAVDGLVALLDLEAIEQDIFRGVSTRSRWQRASSISAASKARLPT